ncbi:beta family protein [Streptomyces avermitilis]|uniref:beta family protein n=1 Tax=Streptomyces avermitilis TaxID=33903 RepID=UPI0033AA7FC5
MVEPIYVPVLSARRDAWNAYAQLDIGVRRRIAPLWTLVPRTGTERTRGACAAVNLDSDQTALGTWLAPRVDQLIEAMDGMTGWVDATHVEDGVHGAATSLWRLMTRSGLRVVTGPERDPTLQRYAADLAFLSRRGIGIRVLADAPPDELRSAELLRLLDRLCLPPSMVDLILDMGAVADATDASKTAIAALDLLGALVPWRTVVLTAGAFPRVHDSPGEEFAYIAERHDRQLYQAVHAARPVFSGAVLYGDYSVEHAFSANIPHIRAPGPAWGVMRYTGPDGFLIGRVPTRDSHRFDRVGRVRAMARWITESGAYRGADYGDGERWLHACAHGEGSKGSGNAETWIKVGHVQHMNFVVNQLADRDASPEPDS